MFARSSPAAYIEGPSALNCCLRLDDVFGRATMFARECTGADPLTTGCKGTRWAAAPLAVLSLRPSADRFLRSWGLRMQHGARGCPGRPRSCLKWLLSLASPGLRPAHAWHVWGTAAPALHFLLRVRRCRHALGCPARYASCTRPCR